MTVDSAYYTERYGDDGETEFPFLIESIGEVAIQVYLVMEDGTRIKLTPTPEA